MLALPRCVSTGAEDGQVFSKSTKQKNMRKTDTSPTANIGTAAPFELKL